MTCLVIFVLLKEVKENGERRVHYLKGFPQFI